MTVIIQQLTTTEFSSLVPSLVDLYLDAMGYNDNIRDSRIKAWRLAVIEENFYAVCAHDNTRVVGIAYGYKGRKEHWWDQEVRRGLREAGGATSEQLAMLNNYFSVTEIHVCPTMQGHGIGRTLLQELLAHAVAPWIMLSTPEVENEDNNAFKLYRSLGFTDVLRSFYFRGDSRPFAIMALPHEIGVTPTR